MAEQQGERIAIVRNPASGTAPEVATLEQALRKVGVDARVCDSPAGDAFVPWLDRLAADVDVLVAAGGDGTVSAVATAAAKAGKTLAIIPCGTLNHFAMNSPASTSENANRSTTADCRFTWRPHLDASAHSRCRCGR